MPINKVIYDSQTLVDLTADTVTPDTLAAGATTHDKSGAAIVGTAYKNTYYVKGTQTAATGNWTGVLSEVNALFEGLTIDYWLPFAGSGNATLNLTLKGGATTGKVNCYRDNANRLTTQVGANCLMRLVYQTVTISGTSYTGWWLVRTLDNNTTDIVNLYEGSAAYAAKSAVYRYQLLFQTDANTLTPLNNVDNNTGTGKTMLTSVDFMPFGKIYYYNSTTAVSANGNMTTALQYHRQNIDLRFTLNCGSTLTAHRDVYLKCVKQSNGMFRIASGTCWTQTLPTTNDGYYYLFLGRANSTYQMTLYTEHPIYYYDGGLKELLDHNHDERYYTESEIDTKLSGKLSDAPSDGKKYARKNGAWAEVPDILYFSQQAVSSATSAEIMRVTNSAITADTVVLECTFANPGVISTDVSWTSAAGYISFTGTCIAATTANVTLAKKSN